MAKRRMDSDLDDIVMNYLMKIKCGKTSKMFETERKTEFSGENDDLKSLTKFIEFVKQRETEKENRVDDDLGFEINFGAFQPATKVSRSVEFCIHKYNFSYCRKKLEKR